VRRRRLVDRRIDKLAPSDWVSKKVSPAGRKRSAMSAGGARGVGDQAAHLAGASSSST